MADAKAQARELRDRGIQLMKSGDRPHAQELLVQSLELNSHDEHAWIWLCSAADTDEERHFCLQKVLELNPANEWAQHALVKLSLAAAPAPAPAAAPPPQSAALSALGQSAAGSAPAAAAQAAYGQTASSSAAYQPAGVWQTAEPQPRGSSGVPLKALAAMLLFLSLSLFMGWQLYQQAQVRGWIEGRRVETHKITQRYVGIRRRGFTCWVSWTNIDVGQRGDHRVNVPMERCDGISIGQPIRLVFIGDSTAPYLAEGDIWANDGNILFNVVLGGVALLLALLMGWYASYVSKSGAS